MKNNHFGKIPGAVGKCVVRVSMRDIVKTQQSDQP